MHSRHILFLSLVVVLGVAGVAGCSGQADVESLIMDAYLAVHEASARGGDVSSHVSLLNDVIDEVGSGEYDSASVESRLEALIASAEAAGAQGVEARESQTLVAGAQVAAAFVLSLATWRYFPELFWGMWLRIRGGWLVKKP